MKISTLSLVLFTLFIQLVTLQTTEAKRWLRVEQDEKCKHLRCRNSHYPIIRKNQDVCQCFRVGRAAVRCRAYCKYKHPQKPTDDNVDSYAFNICVRNTCFNKAHTMSITCFDGYSDVNERGHARSPSSQCGPAYI
eukprot:Pgem_evm2s1668